MAKADFRGATKGVPKSKGGFVEADRLKSIAEAKRIRDASGAASSS